MSAPILMLEKARTEELTTSDVEQALRELREINGGSSYPSLRVRRADWDFKSRICWPMESDTTIAWGHWSKSIEDALVYAYDDILSVRAEQDAAE